MHCQAFITRLVTKSEASHSHHIVRKVALASTIQLGIMSTRSSDGDESSINTTYASRHACDGREGSYDVSSSAGVGKLMCLAETSVMARTTLLMQRDALACDISAVSATVSWKLPVAR